MQLQLVTKEKEACRNRGKRDNVLHSLALCLAVGATEGFP